MCRFLIPVPPLPFQQIDQARLPRRQLPYRAPNRTSTSTSVLRRRIFISTDQVPSTVTAEIDERAEKFVVVAVFVFELLMRVRLIPALAPSHTHDS